MLRISACTAPFSEGGSCAPASATATQIAANELRIISAWMRPRESVVCKIQVRRPTGETRMKGGAGIQFYLRDFATVLCCNVLKFAFQFGSEPQFCWPLSCSCNYHKYSSKSVFSWVRKHSSQSLMSTSAIGVYSFAPPAHNRSTWCSH